jgi:hypothetical protein
VYGLVIQMRHLPSHNAAATTVALLIAILFFGSLCASQRTGIKTLPVVGRAVRLATRCLDFTPNRSVGEVAAYARRSHQRRRRAP